MTPTPRMLASDLDGTLIRPITEDDRSDEIDRFRDAVAARRLDLAYVTGRDFELALRGVGRVGLPTPGILVCDVGTSIYMRGRDGDGFVLDEDYRARMSAALGGAVREDILAGMGGLTGMELQEERKQTEFKISYYVVPEREPALRLVVEERLAAFPVPPKAVWSHDPHSGRSLLDLLPRGVAKHVALEHVRARGGYDRDEIVYAGDSGNDFDAFLSGHPAIVVANAPASLKDEVRRSAAEAHVADKVYFASAPFAGGVLEGCRHFGAL